MKIRHFLVSITCYDKSNVNEEAVEEAILHGMIEGGGPVHAAYITERVIPVQDIDYSRSGPAFDNEIGQWDRLAERALKSFSLKAVSNEAK